jgi:hypothetical protein
MRGSSAVLALAFAASTPGERNPSSQAMRRYGFASTVAPSEFLGGRIYHRMLCGTQAPLVVPPTSIKILACRNKNS